MSDWITKLKQSDDDAARKAQTEDELRLHKAKVVEAKAPSFWESVLDQLEEDCVKLSKAFPNEFRRQCAFARQGLGCELHGHAEGNRILRLSLDAKGTAIDHELISGIGNDRRSRRSSLAILADSQESLYLMEDTFRFNSSEIIAEAFIKRVCEIYE